MVHIKSKINGAAIFFDFDGTLADTMEDNYKSWDITFKDLGIKIKREDYFPLEGMSLREIVKLIIKKYNGKDLEIDKIIRKKEEIFRNINKFSLYEGSIELIDKLKDNQVFLALVSAALRDRIFKTTPLEFLSKFNIVITSDNFERFKPYPDPYLKALNASGLEAGSCIVVENSPFGIKAAKSAELYCIAIASTLDKSYLKEADEVVSNLSELKNCERIASLLR